jgi:hypothetical protein
MDETRVLVVGAGIAGMSCALRLQEAGIDYRIVSDTLGGRVDYSPVEKVNFGAYFVMANYANARKILRRETWINPLACCFHQDDGAAYPTVSGHTLLRGGRFVQFGALMVRFMRHYASFKKNCERMPQREAMVLDPYIGRLFRQPASAWVREHHLDSVAADYVSKFTYACTGVSLEHLTALDALNVCQGLLLPIHRFSFDEPAMARRLGGHLVRDRVDSLRTVDGRHVVTCASRAEYTADLVVLATPALETQRLLDLPAIRDTCELFVFHVKATLRPPFAPYEMNLFPFESSIVLTALQDDGSFLVYTREPDADLAQVCESWELIGSRAWRKAMYVTGSAYLEQQYGPTLFTAGDHNGLGLEPAAISGVYAANQVIRAAGTFPARTAAPASATAPAPEREPVPA